MLLAYYRMHLFVVWMDAFIAVPLIMYKMLYFCFVHWIYSPSTYQTEYVQDRVNLCRPQQFLLLPFVSIMASGCL